MSVPNYTTREVVKAALDNRGGSSTDTQIDRLIATTSRAIERRMHRQFWPWLGTRHFTRPDDRGPGRFSPSWLLELGADELIRLDALESGGTPVDLAAALLEPANAGPPFSRIELDRGTSAAFDTGNTPQRAIAVTGLFGYDLNEVPAGATVGPTTDDFTDIQVTDSSAIGTGSLLRVGAERMIVTRMGLVDTGVTLTSALTDRANDQVLYTTGGVTAPNADEVVTVGAERMLVTDRVGSAVFVKRAVDGTAIAAHGISDVIYARRSLIVERAACGTTATSHAADAPVWRWVPLQPIETLCVEETIAALMQEGAGMARVVGTAEGQRETTNRGLDDARKNADRYRRRNRNQAV